MTQPISFRDVEKLSAYLDNQVSLEERKGLEARLQNDPELRDLLNDLSQTSALLKRLPARKAPRNFRLTPEMAGVKPPIPWVFPIFRFASITAVALLLITLVANLSGPAVSTYQAAAPALVEGSGAVESYQNAAPFVPAATAPESARESEPQATNSVPLETGEPAAVFAAPEAGTSEAQNPTPEISLMVPAATPSAEVLGPGKTQLPQARMAKSTPVESAPPEQIPQPVPGQPFIPTWIQFGLLGLAVISGGLAYWLRESVEENWIKANALKPSNQTYRRLLIVILVLLVVIALVAAIMLLAPANLNAP